MKLYIIRFSDELAYLEEFEYSDHEQRYEKTKGIGLDKIFEPSQLEKALEKVYQLNRM